MVTCNPSANVAGTCQVGAQEGEKKLGGFYFLTLIDTELMLDLESWLRLVVCGERFPQPDRSHVLGTARVSHLKSLGASLALKSLPGG